MNAEFRYGGVEDFVRIATNAAGQAYIDECRNEHGVPVPDFVIDPSDSPRWRLHEQPNEFITDPFIRPDLDAELWSYNPGDGSGFCMAVARKTAGLSEVETLGLICQSVTTGRACFFAKDKTDTLFSPPAPGVGAKPIGEMLGGMDLATDANDEGVCTNCHMGANAFIVHPDDPTFEGAMAHYGSDSVIPAAWMTPVVPNHVGWPGNPPPLVALPPTEGANCSQLACHGSAAGRLPIVSTDTADYCANVIRSALGASAVPATMPSEGSNGDFSAHADWLLGACDLAPGLGQVVPFRPPGPVDPVAPSVEAPYACTRFVRATSVVPDAVLTLVLGSTVMDVAVADYTGEHTFKLETELVLGQDVSVIQAVNGQSSEAGTVKVKSHVDDWGDELPAPVFPVTPVYKCASSLLVANIPGAQVTVTKFPVGGGDPTIIQKEVGGPKMWADFIAGGEFEVDDEFEVQQRICQDDSKASPRLRVTERPSGDLPEFNISALTDGQPGIFMTSIVQGAHVSVEKTPGNSIIFDIPSFPFRRASAGPLDLVTGDTLFGEQTLCGFSSPESHGVQVQACDPDTFVPEIATPRAGDTGVVVTSATTGATIRVFSTLGLGVNDDPDEIGNGAGTVIAIERPLVAGETLSVVQELPTCAPTNAYTIAVQN